VVTDATTAPTGTATTSDADVLLPAKKRAALCALVLAITMDVVAMATGSPTPALQVSYVGMIVLYLALLGVSRRLQFGPRFEMLAVVTISTGLLLRYAVALFSSSEIVGAGDRLFSIHAGLIVMYLLAFTCFDKKQAGAVSTMIMAAGVAVLAARLAVQPALELRVEGQPHIRTVAVHGICIALLYVLSASKEQMQQSQAAASALTIVAGTDELTGLANRRALTADLAKEIARSDRQLTPLSVILIDLDRFKAVNDTHGHAMGDTVLEHTASVLLDSIRASDVAGRWGGEEFLIIAPDAPGPAASGLAERCRQALRQHHVEGLGSVTASFGVASYELGDTLESLVSRADEALYAAKANGRDRVELAAPRVLTTGDLLPGPTADH
jgi:diguanylate cyclase